MSFVSATRPCRPSQLIRLEKDFPDNVRFKRVRIKKKGPWHDSALVRSRVLNVWLAGPSERVRALAVPSWTSRVPLFPSDPSRFSTVHSLSASRLADPRPVKNAWWRLPVMMHQFILSFYGATQPRRSMLETSRLTRVHRRFPSFVLSLCPYCR